MYIETVANNRAEFNRFPFIQAAENLSGGSSDALDQEHKSPVSGRKGRWGSDGQERGFFNMRNTELEILTGARVGGNKIGGVGDVDSNVEKGFSGVFDEGERGRSPKGSVVAKSGGGNDRPTGREEGKGEAEQDRHGGQRTGKRGGGG